jgi:hypothetical protein
MRERDVEAALVAAVEAAGGLALKFTSPGRRSVPDRIVILPISRVVLPGETVFVECKAPGAKCTAAQLREHERIRNAGGFVYVIDSVEAARTFPEGF